MTNSYTREQRKIAKEKQIPLATLAFDDRHLPKGEGSWSYRGAIPEEIKQKIIKLFMEIAKYKPPEMVKKPKNET